MNVTNKNPAPRGWTQTQHTINHYVYNDQVEIL